MHIASAWEIATEMQLAGGGGDEAPSSDAVVVERKFRGGRGGARPKTLRWSVAYDLCSIENRVAYPNHLRQRAGRNAATRHPVVRRHRAFPPASATGVAGSERQSSAATALRPSGDIIASGLSF